MTAAVCSTVIASATAHAYWNLRFKQAGGGFALLALSKAIEAVALAPVLLMAEHEWPHLRAAWFLPLAGAVLVAANYATTAVAYQRAAFSLVYPAARGAVLLFLPPLSFCLLDERIDWFGASALLLIVAAIGLLPLERFEWPSMGRLARGWCGPGLRYAWAAAFCGAGYTICAAYAVQQLTPLTYFAAYTVIVGSACAAWLALSHRRAGTTWPRQWPEAARIAAFNTISYVLMLYTLQSGSASYVTGVRQLGIAIGAVLGWRLFGEHLSVPRRVGIALLVAGCVGVSFTT